MKTQTKDLATFLVKTIFPIETYKGNDELFQLTLDKFCWIRTEGIYFCFIFGLKKYIPSHKMEQSNPLWKRQLQKGFSRNRKE